VPAVRGRAVGCLMVGAVAGTAVGALSAPKRPNLLSQLANSVFRALYRRHNRHIQHLAYHLLATSRAGRSGATLVPALHPGDQKRSATTLGENTG
jgi:gas vesicle protein